MNVFYLQTTFSQINELVKFYTFFILYTVRNHSAYDRKVYT